MWAMTSTSILPLTVTSDHLHNGSSSRYSLMVLNETSMVILPKYLSSISSGSSSMLERSTKNPSLYDLQVFSLSVRVSNSSLFSELVSHLPKRYAALFLSR